MHEDLDPVSRFQDRQFTILLLHLYLYAIDGTGISFAFLHLALVGDFDIQALRLGQHDLAGPFLVDGNQSLIPLVRWRQQQQRFL